MGAISGGVFYDPYYGRNVTWRPVGGVVDEYAYYTHTTKDGYTCLGVLGNRAHWMTPNGEGHTSRGTGSTTNNAGKTVSPIKGWVYAIDGRVPEPAKFEQWFLRRLRGGVYTHLIWYFNINNRHWNRSQTSGGRMFAQAYSSGDDHLHLQFMPGSEYSHSSILSDYEYWRSTGKDRTPPPPATPSQPWVDATAKKLGAIHLGDTGKLVKIMEGLLTANGYATTINGTAIENTMKVLRSYQTDKRVSVVDGKPSGVCDEATWLRLVPDALPQLIWGSTGLYVAVGQALLCAQDFKTAIDGDAGDDTIAKLKAFQAYARVPDSVVNGRGDGIGGEQTWKRLFTV